MPTNATTPFSPPTHHFSAAEQPPRAESSGRRGSGPHARLQRLDTQQALSRKSPAARPLGGKAAAAVRYGGRATPIRDEKRIESRAMDAHRVAPFLTPAAGLKSGARPASRPCPRRAPSESRSATSQSYRAPGQMTSFRRRKTRPWPTARLATGVLWRRTGPRCDTQLAACARQSHVRHQLTHRPVLSRASAALWTPQAARVEPEAAARLCKPRQRRFPRGASSCLLVHRGVVSSRRGAVAAQPPRPSRNGP